MPRTQYEIWRERQSVPIVRGTHIEDLCSIACSTWDRYGCDGAIVDLQGIDEGQGTFILSVAPGKMTIANKHLFEALVFIFKGNATVRLQANRNLTPVTFDCATGAVFGLPPNITYVFENTSATDDLRVLMVTAAPIVMNLFHNEDFVFDNDFDFKDRFDGQNFSTNGISYTECAIAPTVMADLFSDVRTCVLPEWPERGGGGRTLMLEVCSGTLTAHISEFDAGNYKKAHRHSGGAHVVILSGTGYTLMWPEGSEPIRCDWKANSLVIPPEGWFHQHFNTGKDPARYLALRWESARYPLQRWRWAHSKSLKDGGDQIEYEEESPEIRETFENEMRLSAGTFQIAQ